MQRELQYSRVTLNRADGLRRSDDEVNALWNHPDCRIVLMHNSRSFFDQRFNAVTVHQSDLTAHGLKPDSKTFLGLDSDNCGWFSVQCSDDDASKWCSIYPDAAFQDLRAAGAALDPDIASILACARGLSHWQSVSQYCSKCGGGNELESAGHSMRCRSCESQTFPRTDPAVIMLVHHEDNDGNKKCLLGRSPAWPEGCYSTLAGFVESGESLEAAVIREVFEDQVSWLKNRAMLPRNRGPFPQSIMLGFVASAVSSEIVLDEEELANAGWFSAAEIAKFGEWADDGDGLKLPRVDSIARYLIDSWVANQN